MATGLEGLASSARLADPWLPFPRGKPWPSPPSTRPGRCARLLAICRTAWMAGQRWRVLPPRPAGLSPSWRKAPLSTCSRSTPPAPSEVPRRRQGDVFIYAALSALISSEAHIPADLALWTALSNLAPGRADLDV